jgi:hypothetical protein
LQNLYYYYEERILEGARQKQIETCRAEDGSAEDPIGGIDRGEKAAGHLSDEVAPEERRVHGALHRDAPLERHRRVLVAERHVVQMRM